MSQSWPAVFGVRCPYSRDQVECGLEPRAREVYGCHSEPGEIWCHHDYFDGYDQPPVLHIDRADPVIWVAAEIIEAIERGEVPGATLDVPACGHGDHQTCTFIGAVLRLHAEDRTLVYVITGMGYQRLCYEARWPD